MPDDINGIRVNDLPALGAVTQASKLAGVKGVGAGLFAVDALRSYLDSKAAVVLLDSFLAANRVPGTTNDALALQAAYDALAATGGVVVASAQPYWFFTAATPHAPIMVRGQGFQDCIFPRTGSSARPAGGTWFIQANPAVAVLRYTDPAAKNSGVEDVAFFQPGHAAPAPGWAPTVYEWTILGSDVLGTIRVARCHFHNVYRGIRLDACFRPDLENITGQFFYRGIEIDRNYDIGRLNRLHAWTYWSESDDVLAWTQANSWTISTYKCDGFFVDDLFAFGVSIGWYVGLGTDGSTNVAFCGKGYFDFTGKGVVVAASNVSMHLGEVFHLGASWPLRGTNAPLPGALAVLFETGFTNIFVQCNQLRSVGCPYAVVRLRSQASQLYIGEAAFEQYNKDLTAGAPACVIDNVAAASFVRFGSQPFLAPAAGGQFMLSDAGSNGIVEMPVRQIYRGDASVNSLVAFAGPGLGDVVISPEGATAANLDIRATGIGGVKIGMVGDFGVQISPPAGRVGFFGTVPITKRAMFGVTADERLNAVISILQQYGLVT